MNVARAEQYIQTLLQPEAKHPRQRKAPDVRLFLSGLCQDLAAIQSAGIAAVSSQQETDREIVLTITIPKKGAGVE